MLPTKKILKKTIYKKPPQMQTVPQKIQKLESKELKKLGVFLD